MNNQALRYFAYVRKSTDEPSRQVQSLADQKAELATYAQNEQLPIIRTFEESLTAKVPGRPVFNEMLARVEAGEANGIVAWHPDRLARNSIDGGRIIHSIDSGLLASLKFPTWWFEPSPQGLFALSMAFGQSKYYVDNLSENIRRSYRQKAARGLWPGRAPLGYLHDQKTKGIKPDPELAPAIHSLYLSYARGDATFASLQTRCEKMGFRARSGRPLSLSRIQAILRHPVYSGMVMFHGEQFEGVHEPIVSKELFDKVQEVMADRSRPRSSQRKVAHPCRGIFRCGECGCAITSETQKGHTYMRCTKKKQACSQRYLREDRLRPQIDAAVYSLSIPESTAERWLEELEDEEKIEHDQLQTKIAKLNDLLSSNDEQLERLKLAYLSKAIELEEYAASKNKLMDEKVRLKSQKKHFEKKPSSMLEPERIFIEACKQARFLALSSDLAAKCQFLQYVGSNLKIRDQKIHFVPRGAWKNVAISSETEKAGLKQNCVSMQNRGGFTKRRRLLKSIRKVIKDTPLLVVSQKDSSSERWLVNPSTHPSY